MSVEAPCVRIPVTPLGVTSLPQKRRLPPHRSLLRELQGSSYRGLL